MPARLWPCSIVYPWPLTTSNPSHAPPETQGRTALHHAAAVGSLGLVRRLMAAAPAAVTMPAFEGRLPIHRAAARRGGAAIVATLLAVAPWTATSTTVSCLTWHCISCFQLQAGATPCTLSWVSAPRNLVQCKLETCSPCAFAPNPTTPFHASCPARR